MLLMTAACASMQSTPQQEATWAIMRACDHFNCFGTTTLVWGKVD
jgi:hypothetical protein